MSMFGWICVAVASAFVAVKNGTAWYRSHRGQSVVHEQLKPAPPEIVKNLTSLVREPRAKQTKGLRISTSGFYGNKLPNKLDHQLYWTGKGNFSKAHRIGKTAKSRFPYICTPSTLIRDSFGACFVKNVEGYRVPSSIHHSPPLTCKEQGLCTITATFNFSNTIPFNSSLSSNDVLNITQPSNVLELAYPTNATNLTVTQTFRGPGTREILLKPILWSVMGVVLPTVPLGQPENNQSYVMANFLMLVNGQIDAIYMLHEPKQTSTILLQ